MRNALRAEFRKITTVSSWWVLLVPAVLLTLLWSWLGVSFLSLIGRTLGQTTQGRLDTQFPDLPWASFALSRAINVATMFPMLLGALAIAGEMHRRTLSTTFLTARSRQHALTAKLLAYAAMGAVYGIIIVIVASVGTWLGALSSGHTNYLPSVGVWVGVALAGVLSCVLWTLVGVAVGALFGNLFATIALLLVYVLLVENLLALIPLRYNIKLAAFWPNQAADGMVGKISSADFVERIHGAPEFLRAIVAKGSELAAGSAGTYSWWIEGLIFTAWTAVLCAAGWWALQRRDIG